MHNKNNNRDSPWKLAVFFVLVIGVGTFVCSASENEDKTRKGAWVDEVIAEVEASEATALRRMDAGRSHVYAHGITDAALHEEIQGSEELEYEQHMGTSSELSFNPAGPELEGTDNINPFAVPRIREAMNWLVDRDYIVEEIYGGLAKERWLPISSVFAEYSRVIETARTLEQRYQHDSEKANDIIHEEMEALGARKEGGNWHFKGEPVELRLLIRTEDERREIGDYVATLLENAGFYVERQYRTAEEASPVWSGSDPAEGGFHIYTGSWISTVVEREEVGVFNFYYTPKGNPSPLWQAYEPDQDFRYVADRLGRRDYESAEERSKLLETALEKSLRDSVRIWLADQISISPRKKDVSLAADLGGGISGAYLWPYTLRFEGRTGGSMRIAIPDLLTEPWNPLDGSNWIYDMMFSRATSDFGALVDPYTGLSMPQRIEEAWVVVEEGLPVEKNRDWVELEFSEEIEVPQDAWIDWDAESRRFIEAGEKHPEGISARRKSVVRYPEGLEDIAWHDGSALSAADMIMSLILIFDRADEESELFDEARLPAFDSFKEHFRGVRVKNKSPLVIETYSNSYNLDAENNVTDWFPAYQHGPGAWHALAVGILAEKAERLAFSSSKAERLEVEWTSMVSGPSLDILGEKLHRAGEENYLPYENVLAEFVGENEVSQRWDNLERWYEEKNHLWVGNGPFYLESVYPVEKIVHLKRFEDFPDPAGKWERFEEPMTPQVDLRGPRSISSGSAAEFEAQVQYEDKPYPLDHLQDARYFWYDAEGNLAAKGEAEPIGDGKFRITLSECATEEQTYGPNLIEFVTVSEMVSLPVFDSIEFVVRP